MINPWAVGALAGKGISMLSDDKDATKWLYISFIPLFIGYSIYNLIYNEHRGWYSFILESLVGFIYVFGKFKK